MHEERNSSKLYIKTNILHHEKHSPSPLQVKCSMLRKEMVAHRPEYQWKHKIILGEQNAGLECRYQRVSTLSMTSCCEIQGAEGKHKPSVTTLFFIRNLSELP
jgi:hypothetical protein